MRPNIGHVLAALQRDERRASNNGASYAQRWALETLKGSLFKKYLDSDRTTPEQDKLALEKFIDCNRKCAQLALCTFTREDRKIDTYVKLWLFRELSNFNVFTWAKPDMVGPGASRGCTSNDKWTKLWGSCMTTNHPYSYSLYLSSIPTYPQKFAEAERAAKFGAYRKVNGSSLSFVPKQADVSRVICTEPLLSMMHQKAIGAFLESVLIDKFNIDLRRQQHVNRLLAKDESKTGRFATIDLSSASDSISMNLLEYLLPRSFLNEIKIARSRFTRLPDGRSLKLHMVSSNGNGFTFPLETMLFAVIVQACYACLGIRASEGVNVNGDDIICRTEAYDLICHTLMRYGFTVNHKKSFSHGPFRESCGGDYLYGVSVRGVYIKSLKNDAEITSAINRLRLWSRYHQIPLFSTLRVLVALLRKRVYVAPSLEYTSGLFCDKGSAVWRRLGAAKTSAWTPTTLLTKPIKGSLLSLLLYASTGRTPLVNARESKDRCQPAHIPKRAKVVYKCRRVALYFHESIDDVVDRFVGKEDPDLPLQRIALTQGFVVTAKGMASTHG
jgi:hypothetical protein